MDEEDRPLDGEAIIVAFNAAGVDYVIIGGFAAQARRAPVPPTHDIDFTPATDPGNLERVGEALRSLDARLRTPGVPEGMPFDPAPQLVGKMKMLNLTCRYGHFDLSFFPSGTDGFPDLVRRATVLTIGGTEARVADLADIIRSKQAASRPKDQLALPALELFASEQGIDIEARGQPNLPAPDRPASAGRKPRPASAAEARRRLREMGDPGR
jgi:hypothetical protein